MSLIKDLLKAYKKNKRLVIAVDFDGTILLREGWNYDLINLLTECQKRDFHIVLFTAAVKERFPFMVESLESFGVKISSINENPIPLKFGNNGKMYYNLLLDDRAGLNEATETLKQFLQTIN